MARTVCYSQLNLTSDRLYDLMWFSCRLWWHIRFVEFGSFLNLVGFFSLSSYICNKKGSEILSTTGPIVLQDVVFRITECDL